MQKLTVKVKKLNKRKRVPAFLPDANNIVGTVNENFVFQGDEVVVVPNPSLGKWYKDRDDNFYWGGGLLVEDIADDVESTDNNELEDGTKVTPRVKRKIERVINAFETGTAEGKYGALVKLKDFQDPATGTRIVQVTYGRSQTTEFGHLKTLIEDYVEEGGIHANALRPYLQKIGKKPSLATDDLFCNTLKDAGNNDPLMKKCQDELFEAKYYSPAFNWFTQNGFTLPLSMLVIYDSRIHSGGILKFLRKRFPTVVPAAGGDEKEWITNYVNARHNWLANHSDSLLRKTVYRTACFREQFTNDNWGLTEEINAHGVKIS